MSRLYDTIGKSDPTYLQADPNGCQKEAVSVEPGHGVIARGTVLYRKSSGMYAPASAAEAVDANDLVVADESVDTDAEAHIAEVAAAYRAGQLVRDRVLLADGTPVSDAVALALRRLGIHMDRMNDWAKGETVFDNEKP